MKPLAPGVLKWNVLKCKISNIFSFHTETWANYLFRQYFASFQYEISLDVSQLKEGLQSRKIKKCLTFLQKFNWVI